jgi:hypothetical protein
MSASTSSSALGGMHGSFLWWHNTFDGTSLKTEIFKHWYIGYMELFCNADHPNDELEYLDVWHALNPRYTDTSSLR